ncbi:putative membrane protein [Sesamum angolense]|uniref:Membrane protein n=1 Tax=Sesamum angolense TaxID=2727404 RepID=A0AAE1WGF9_9LAMI|nr:putative membrane protein [Sesamum angolense]
MEPPRGLWASVWNFFFFLPFFIGLLILGFIKGIIMFPVIFLIMTFAISVIILGLWPIHCFYTYYCILSTKQFGPALKLVLSICIAAVLISWPPVGIACSLLCGAAYGLLAPIFATFQAVNEGKTNKFYHCICDGTWSALKGSFTIIRDFLDVCYHSYFSIMDDIRRQGPPEGKYYEIRLLYVPLALIAGILGSIVDLPVISVIALCKSPYMLFKGWHRLFHDCIGREGPFLETICVPFAGLAILLWPLAVVGAVLGSIVSSIFLGAYAAVIVYQLMRCSRSVSSMGKFMALEGIITPKDIEDAKSKRDRGSDKRWFACLLPSSDTFTLDQSQFYWHIARPKDTFFDWFLNPLLIIKDQIKASNLSEAEEQYLGKLVLLSGDPARLKNSNIGPEPESELRRAELDALARRLQGITKSISRYPTFRRRFESSMKNILEELAKKNGGGEKSGSTEPQTVPRSKSMFARIFSQKSFKSRTNDEGPDQKGETRERDVEIA